GLLVPARRGRGPADLVRGDLLPVPRPADDDRGAARVGGRAGGRPHDVRRVVVARLVRRWPAVDHIVPGRRHRLGEGRLQLEAGMIRSEVNAHARQSGTAGARGTTGPPPGPTPARRLAPTRARPAPPPAPPTLP